MAPGRCTRVFLPSQSGEAIAASHRAIPPHASPLFAQFHRTVFMGNGPRSTRWIRRNHLYRLNPGRRSPNRVPGS